jgi:hypothetical protein
LKPLVAGNQMRRVLRHVKAAEASQSGSVPYVPSDTDAEVLCDSAVILCDDDGYKPVWPSGLWATSQGGETYSRQPHTTLHRGFLAIHFVKVKWYLVILCDSAACSIRTTLAVINLMLPLKCRSQLPRRWRLK